MPPPRALPLTPLPDLPPRACDVLVVRAGAAGRGRAPAPRAAGGAAGALRPAPRRAPRVVLLTNERRLGLKILVSGGGRCNVTNEQVSEHDYLTDAPHLLRGVLRAFPAASTVALFEAAGCRLYAEPLGKLFPRSDRARDVLEALLRAVDGAGIPLVAPAEVSDLAPPAAEGSPWRVKLAGGASWAARRVVLATGGKSLPKTGSRGVGFDLLPRLGHTLEPPVPALTPLRFASDGPLQGLAGITVPAALTLAPRDVQPEQVSGARFRPLARAAGSFLITHQGASGPAALDVSGPCGRALARGEEVSLLLDVWSLAQEDGPWAPFLDLPKPPGASLRHDAAPRPPTREAFLARAQAAAGAARDRAIGLALWGRLPRALTQALLRAVGVDPAQPARQVDARAWRAIHLALTQADLRVVGTDGYGKAEVTAGGVLLAELGRTTLESRRQPGLFVCGEVVNVTGRLGGFNFQWAWSSGFAAGAAAAASLRA